MYVVNNKYLISNIKFVDILGNNSMTKNSVKNGVRSMTGW